MAYGPVYPHDPIEEIADDVFMARGRIPLNALLRLSRNMAILRHQGELTLVNPIRLDEAGEAQLRGLGEVKRIFRLGAYHGVDDPYYVDTFGAEFWSQAGGTTYPNPPIDKVLAEGVELPFPDAEMFYYRGTKEPESMLLLKKDGGHLLTCDGIQHYGDYRHNNLAARIVMPFIGFPKRVVVGPFWLKLMTPEGSSLKGELERLLQEWKFDALLSAHGSFLPTGAYAAVTAAVGVASFPGE